MTLLKCPLKFLLLIQWNIFVFILLDLSVGFRTVLDSVTLEILFSLVFHENSLLEFWPFFFNSPFEFSILIGPLKLEFHNSLSLPLITWAYSCCGFNHFHTLLHYLNQLIVTFLKKKSFPNSLTLLIKSQNHVVFFIVFVSFKLIYIILLIIFSPLQCVLHES